jgi:succinoglycan biosynthesis transport protein ExoP
MYLNQYVRVLRAHWVLVVLSVLACTGAAALLAWTRTPIYEARTQLFVSTTGAPTNLAEAYQGGLFTQQRVESYAEIVPSPAVARAVIKELRLSKSVQDVQEEIRASVPDGSVLIDVRVRDRSPRLAKAIADAVGRHFSGFVNALERSPRGRSSPVKVSVTNPARRPSDPVSPQKPLYLTLGALLGLILGIGGAVLREALGKRIRSDDDAEAAAGAPVLGRIAEDQNAKERPVIVADDPLSVPAEGYRRLRTNLHALGADRGHRSFVVSSAVASEGKTQVVANLGVAFAQAGHKVVLVDADLRRPRLASVLGLNSPAGLADVLAYDFPLEVALCRPTDLPLEVLPSGPPPANPSELLGSERFVNVLRTLTDRVEVVILDTPALLPVADAAILAQLASGVILVTRVGSTRADQLGTAAQYLRAIEKQVLGVVLNRLPARDHRKYGYYGPAAGGW